MKTYFSSIDFLRGFAALMVAFFHFTHHNSIHGTLLESDDFLYKIGHYGQYGVHLFFVISGFVIPYSMNKYNYSINKLGKFLLKRIARIEPPFLLSMLWVVLSGVIFSIYLGTDISIDWQRIMLHLGYLIPFTEEVWYNDIYWTLAIEFQYYLFIALTFPFLIHKNRIIQSALLGFLAIAPLFFLEGFFFSYAPVFGLGIIGALLKLNKVTIQSFFFWVFVFSASILFFIGGTIAVITFITLFLILQTHVKTKQTDFLGKISYSLYLTHGELGGRLIYFLLPFCGSSLFLNYLLLVGAILFSIFGSWIFYLIIENPSKRLASKIDL